MERGDFAQAWLGFPATQKQDEQRAGLQRHEEGKLRYPGVCARVCVMRAEHRPTEGPTQTSRLTPNPKPSGWFGGGILQMTIKGWEGRSGSRAEREKKQKPKSRETETANCRHHAGLAHTRSVPSPWAPGGGRGQADAVAKPTLNKAAVGSFHHFFILTAPSGAARVWLVFQGGGFVVEDAIPIPIPLVCRAAVHGSWCGWRLCWSLFGPPLPCPVLTYYLVRGVFGVLAAREWPAVWRTNPLNCRHHTGVILAIFPVARRCRVDDLWLAGHEAMVCGGEMGSPFLCCLGRGNFPSSAPARRWHHLFGCPPRLRGLRRPKTPATVRMSPQEGCGEGTKKDSNPHKHQ